MELVNIRLAKPEEALTILEAQKQEYEKYSELDPTALNETEQDLVKRITSDKWKVYVGEREGKIIGGISYLLNPVYQSAYTGRIFGLELGASLYMLNNTIIKLPFSEIKKVVYRTFNNEQRIDYFKRMGWELMKEVDKAEFKKAFSEIDFREDRAYLKNTKIHS